MIGSSCARVLSVLCLAATVAACGSSSDDTSGSAEEGAGGGGSGGTPAAGAAGTAGGSSGAGGMASGGAGAGQAGTVAGKGGASGAGGKGASGAAAAGAAGTAGAGGSGGAAGASGKGGAAGTSGAAGTGGATGTTPTTRTISLRTEGTGQYVTVAGASVTAQAPAVEATELLTLTDLDGGALLDGDLVRVATTGGAYVSAVNGGGGALATKSGAPGDFETFVIARLAGAGTIATGDAVAFKAKTMLAYVSAVNGGGGEVRCDQPHALGWETFRMTLDAVVTPPPTGARAKVIAYLSGLGGKKTLTGQHDKLNSSPAGATEQVKGITGKYPALWSADFGFGKDSVDNRGKMIAEAKKQWQAGAVVQIMYHNCSPTRDELCGWDDVGGANPAHLSDAEWNQLVTDGTPLNAAWKARLDALSPYFADLKAAGVAPLFRPLHEMNQGVFWWGGRGGANGTRKLFQITHDYLVKTKGFDNIVWVWDIQDFDTLASDASAYDPGQGYYDIAALDVYGGGYTQAKYDVMKKVAGSKPIAIGECETPPTAALLDSQPDWIFFMLWPDFVDQNAGVLPGLYAAPRMVTRDELPGWQ